MTFDDEGDRYSYFVYMTLMTGEEGAVSERMSRKRKLWIYMTYR